MVTKMYIFFDVTPYLIFPHPEAFNVHIGIYDIHGM